MMDVLLVYANDPIIQSAVGLFLGFVTLAWCFGYRSKM